MEGGRERGGEGGREGGREKGRGQCRIKVARGPWHNYIICR